jgi:hypothetical protein
MHGPTAMSFLAKVRIERVKGPLRRAYLPEEPEPVLFGVHGADSELMPAVDSPQPDGLSYAELRQLLGPFVAADLLAGIQFTIFDPDLDPEGRYAGELAGTIVELLGGP